MADNSIPTETVCKSCEKRFDDPPNYCPNCGSDDFETRPLYDFERDASLPVVFSYEVYDDDYGLWREFTSQVFGAYELRGSDIANCPKLPSMKYMTEKLWFKLTDEYDLEGPFMTKQEAKDA